MRRASMRAAVAVVTLGLPLAAPTSGAQSLLERAPNLSGGWVGTGGTMYFHFLHRFTTSDAPERKVSNAPTFLVAAGLPRRTLVGFNYATNSDLAPRYPNEWEFFVRHLLFRQEEGAPLDVGAEAAYNLASEGADGEVTLARRLGRLRVLGAGRVLADPYAAGETRFAAAGGATLRLARYLALAGDAAKLMNARAGEQLAWSAGVHVAIPYTPHTLSLQATNTNVATLQGTSRGSDFVRYGFEFTIPLTLSRWFGNRTPSRPTSPAPAAAPPPPPPRTANERTTVAAGAARASVAVRNFAFTPARIEVAAGTTIEWKNDDQLAHTVTAVDKSFDSGLLDPGTTWRHTFTTPGEYPFYCTPHPFMKGVVVVR